MESPRGNEFLKFFIGRENRSDSNREVPNVGSMKELQKKIVSFFSPEVKAIYGILYQGISQTFLKFKNTSHLYEEVTKMVSNTRPFMIRIY